MENFLVGFSGGIFFSRILLGDIFWGGFFGKDFFGRTYLAEINNELMFLSRFWGNFVSMQEEGGRILIFKNCNMRIRK